MTANELQNHLESLGDPVRASHCQRFFKTGRGEYGEGDLFRGIPVPKLRKLAKQWREVPLEEMVLLLQSPYHEDRFTALCLLVRAFQHGQQDQVYDTYLESLPFINNWDLVDTSCHKIMGPYLFERPRTILYSLAKSKNLWERRIAIVSTYYFIKRDQYTDTLALSDFLARDSEDLIHKACGWMLREVGKRDESVLTGFLNHPSTVLPRTALRYAIERFPPQVRKQYLDAPLNSSRSTRFPSWRAYLYVMNAARQLRGKVIQTPVLPSETLANPSGAKVFLKLENLQHTGSFKYRGALNKIRALGSSPPPVTVASTGNHGLATSKILQENALDGTIYVPVTTDSSKVESLHELGSSLEFYGEDGVDAEYEARRVAHDQGQVFISPYNDWHIIAGQGTIGVELIDQIGPLNYVFASVGGGGLISGIALALKAHCPKVKIIGCSPVKSNVMHESVQVGHIIEQPAQSTLSDGTAGGIESDAFTLSLCTELVDEWMTATEEEIASAMRLIYRTHHQKIEGAAAVTVACFLRYEKDLTGQKVALVICGGNVSDDTFQAVLSES